MRTTGPGQSAHLLLDVVDILDRMEIRYAVVGAMAAAFHGVVRASQDADAVLAPGSTPSISALAKTMREAGLAADLKRGDPEDPVQGVVTLRDRFENRVDLILGIRGMDPEAFERAAVSAFLGRKLHIVGAEDFVAMKVFAGAPKDLEDARGVLEVSGRKLDRPLLEKLARRYGRRASRSLASLLKTKHS